MTLRLLFILFIFILVCDCDGSIYIGGLFNIFNETGGFDQGQFESLLSFMTAMNDLNLNNQTYKYVVRSGIGVAGTAVAAYDLVEAKIAGVVLNLPNLETIAAFQLFNDAGITTINSCATDSSLGEFVNYPHKANMLPLDSYQGFVLQDIICRHLLLQRVVIFATNDLYGTTSATMFESGSSNCAIEVLATLTFSPYEKDYTLVIDQAMALTSTIFVVFSGPQQAAGLMESGYLQGLFRQGTQVLGCDRIVTTELIRYFTSGADVNAIMNGFIGIEFWPDFSVSRSDEGQEFVNNWLTYAASLNSTENITDCTGYHFLCRNGDPEQGCVQLNMTLYEDHNGTVALNASAALSYDATLSLMEAIERVFETENSTFEMTVDQSLLDVSFYGASGLVEFSKGLALDGSYGRCDRNAGYVFRLMNYIPDAYYVNDNNSFVPVGLWSSTLGVMNCTEDMGCWPIVYNTLDNSIPSAFPPYAFSTAPSIIKIGGLFGMFNVDNTVNQAQAQQVAAFRMAIDNINNKADGIYDDILPNTQLKFAVGYGSGYTGTIKAVESLMKSFYNSGVVGVVGTLPNADTMASYQMLTAQQIVQVHAMAMDSSLGDGVTFPYKAQTCPVDSYQGEVLQHLVCRHFKWSRVSIFATSDTFGIEAAASVVNGKFCSLTVLSEALFDPTTTDFSSHIAQAKAAGAQIFLFFMGLQNSANLLEQGHNSGLFHEGTQVIGSNSSLAYGIKPFFSKKANIPLILRGCLSVQYWPDYGVRELHSGIAFRKRFALQPSTKAEILPDGQFYCSNALDDSGTTYLYRNPHDSSVCGGLNYYQYNSEGSSISPFIAETYDATILLATGLHSLLKHKKTISGPNLINAIFNVTFPGVSGLVGTNAGKASLGYFGQGDRTVGHHYRLMNFNPTMYRSNINNGFAQTAEWSAENGVVPCTQDISCVAPLYNTADNLPVHDIRPNAIAAMSGTGQFILFAVAAVIFFVAGLCTFVVTYFKTSRLIKVSQPVMLNFILIGEYLAAFRVLIAAVPITTGTCIAGLWFGHLAFIFVIGSLSVKTWRVKKILNNTSLKRIAITTSHVIKIMAVVISCMIVLLVILVAGGQPYATSTNIAGNNQTIVQPRCGFVNSGVHTALFVIEGIILAVCSGLSWSVKDVPDAVTEPKAFMFGLIFLAIIAFIVVFILSMPPADKQLVASILFGVASLASMIVLLGAKSVTLLSGNDIHKHHMFAQKAEAAPAASGKSDLSGKSFQSIKTMGFLARMTSSSQLSPMTPLPLPTPGKMAHTDSAGGGSGHSLSRGSHNTASIGMVAIPAIGDVTPPKPVPAAGARRTSRASFDCATVITDPANIFEFHQMNKTHQSLFCKHEMWVWHAMLIDIVNRGGETSSGHDSSGQKESASHSANTHSQGTGTNKQVSRFMSESYVLPMEALLEMPDMPELPVMTASRTENRQDNMMMSPDHTNTIED